MLKVHKNGLFNTGLKNSRNNHEIFELHKHRFGKSNFRWRSFSFSHIRVRDLYSIDDDPSIDDPSIFSNIITNNHLFKINHNTNVDDLTYFDNEEEY